MASFEFQKSRDPVESARVDYRTSSGSSGESRDPAARLRLRDPNTCPRRLRPSKSDIETDQDESCYEAVFENFAEPR